MSSRFCNFLVNTFLAIGIPLPKLLDEDFYPVPVYGVVCEVLWPGPGCPLFEVSVPAQLYYSAGRQHQLVFLPGY
jgi:hypothetical protein